MALLREGEHLLAHVCVSHNYLEFYFCAIEVSLRDGDRAAVERHVAELEAYTRDGPLPWADVVIARGRAAGGDGGPVVRPCAGNWRSKSDESEHRDAVVSLARQQIDVQLRNPAIPFGRSPRS